VLRRRRLPENIRVVECTDVDAVYVYPNSNAADASSVFSPSLFRCKRHTKRLERLKDRAENSSEPIIQSGDSRLHFKVAENDEIRRFGSRFPDVRRKRTNKLHLSFRLSCVKILSFSK